MPPPLPHPRGGLRRKSYSEQILQCLGNLASYAFQSGHGLQYVLFEMLNKYFIAQVAENTYLHFALVKKSK